MELNVFALIPMFMEENIFSNVNKRFCKKKKEKKRGRDMAQVQNSLFSRKQGVKILRAVGQNL